MPIKQIKENTRASRSPVWIKTDTFDIQNIIPSSIFTTSSNLIMIESESNQNVQSSKIEYLGRLLSKKVNDKEIIYGYFVYDGISIKIISNISYVKNTGEVKHIKSGSMYYSLTIPKNIPKDYWTYLDVNLKCWISSNAETLKISSHTNSSKILDNMIDYSMDIF